MNRFPLPARPSAICRREFLAAGAGLILSPGPAAAARSTQGLESASQALKAFVDGGALPFASMRIARNGEILLDAFHSGAGPVSVDSLFRIYSMTKPVVAAATLLICEEGRLTLDTPVGDVIPAFRSLTVATDATGATEPARTMTVAHLLTHASGISNSWNGDAASAAYRAAGLDAGAWMFNPAIGGLDGFAEKIAAVPLRFQPGEGWLYGYSLDIAGLVIQRVSGLSLGDYMKAHLFDPLGMSDTGFQAPTDGAARMTDLWTVRDGAAQVVERGANSALLRPPAAQSGSAGLVSSLRDYGRFADMLACGGSVGGVRVMSPASVALMTSPYGPQDRVAEGLSRFAAIGLGGSGTGLGQALGGVATLSDAAGAGSRGEYSWGGAASTTFWAAPEIGLSVVVMTQRLPSGSVPLRDILRPLIYRALGGG
ncbi:serine hydrolase domain-containing protein [Brevundimonas variabilis]|uniref:CubicO group peptidase (Beta-lactamase class C family) n=1 Tax=Brevundimonas variabilis TaxID=74312 RepID=A0A7W9FEL3_9CAUL|nr:serine hydrolase domain-containing protein [Brevundimonas variabilis]MBB5746591.1 CubicO group peptidase (beta-lactamase class C family) [Brevundimonas variabilis]